MTGSNGNGRSVVKSPTPKAPPTAKRVNGNGHDNGQTQEWRVKRTIPASNTDEQGRTPSEREQELLRTVRNLQQQVQNLQNQVSRFQRFDKESTKVTEHQMLQAVVQSNLALSEQLKRLVDGHAGTEVADPMMQVNLEMQSLHREQKRKRMAEIETNLAYTQRLLRAKQEINPSCPCGEHKGIMFIEREEVLEENMCPKDWWFKQSNHAYYNGQLSQFMKAYPFNEYLNVYRL